MVLAHIPLALSDAGDDDVATVVASAGAVEISCSDESTDVFLVGCLWTSWLLDPLDVGFDAGLLLLLLVTLEVVCYLENR